MSTYHLNTAASHRTHIDSRLWVRCAKKTVLLCHSSGFKRGAKHARIGGFLTASENSAVPVSSACSNQYFEKVGFFLGVHPLRRKTFKVVYERVVLFSCYVYGRYLAEILPNLGACAHTFSIAPQHSSHRREHFDHQHKCIGGTLSALCNLHSHCSVPQPRVLCQMLCHDRGMHET